MPSQAERGRAEGWPWAWPWARTAIAAPLLLLLHGHVSLLPSLLPCLWYVRVIACQALLRFE